ncbi:MAG: hypothetical protein JWL78_534, partial [Chloroflexi bacterium]|nr:hypothetical protein [Chloroflexota bacterium]
MTPAACRLIGPGGAAGLAAAALVAS